MQQSGDKWEAVLEGSVDRDGTDRLAVHSGPLPEALVGAVFIPYRPDIAPTRVGRRGLILVVPEGRGSGRAAGKGDRAAKLVRQQSILRFKF